MIDDPKPEQAQTTEEGQQAAVQAEQERQKSDLENLTGQYHGLTRQQADLIEASRGDPTKGTDGIIESPNEPPGSDPFPEDPGVEVQSQQPDPQQPEQPAAPGATEPGDVGDVDDDLDELPSDAELNAMTRADLDELAIERGLDPTNCPNKAAVIEMLKDAED